MTTTHRVTANGFPSNAFDEDLAVSGDSNSSKRSTALSNKLTNVLSSSFADSDTRDALKLLDTRGAQNAEETRLNLKYDAQQEVIDANAKIVDDFGKVANQLRRVGALITILNQTCDDMRSHIQLAKQETAPMLDEATILLSRKHETESKQQLLNAFNQHFLISDKDLTTLTSSVKPVNGEYFAVLSRVKQIHKDCEILLGYENQRLGLELMEQTTRNLDAGYKKLYNWIQREFKDLDLEDPHISGSIRRSLRALSERPTLFQNCLDIFGEARQATLSEAFQRALTDPTLGASKAIEFSTHDPLRYIGDMLAWAHSTTVSEKEALEGLFISDADEISRGLNAGKSSEPWARLQRTTSRTEGGFASDDEDDEQAPESPFDGHAALNSLISRNMASVSRILFQRISLTTRNLTDQITIYKTYNLLLFYQDIFLKLLGTTNLNSQTPQTNKPASQSIQNTILAALSALESQTLSHFQSTIAENIEAHSSNVDPPPPTLQPPGILTSNLTLFSTILHLRAPNLTSLEFTTLYGTLLVPVVDLCGIAAISLSPDNEETSAQPSDTFDTIIYRLNYMYPIHATLTTLAKDGTLATFVSAPMRSAEQESDRLAEELSESVTERFMVASGVQGLLDLVESLDDTELEMKRTTLADKLEDASGVLDSFLASALMDVQDDLGNLSDKKIGKEIMSDAVESFCEEFEKLVGLLDNLDGEVNDRKGRSSERSENEVNEQDEEALLRELYPRTVTEVRALLS